MLLLDDGTVVYSASDLAVAATCEFALLRGLDAKLGRIAPIEVPADAMLDRLAALGDRHEQQVLADLRRRYGRWDPATGRGVVEIVRPTRAGNRDAAVLAAKREETLAALRAGADVVFQAGFFDGRFSGWADFLVRADDDARTAGQPAGPVYEVHDTKLARHAKVTALLQLAAYADQLIASGIPVADRVHLVLGDRTRTDHALVDLLPVYRDRRARLQAILDEHAADTGPVAWGDERYRACLRCDVCAPEVAARRDVLLVAGVRVAQRARLRAAGVATFDELAGGTSEVPGIAAAALATLRAQARLQVAQDPLPAGSSGIESGTGPTGSGTGSGAPSGTGVSGGLHYELFAPQVVGHLPAPDPGDIFFDFEGDPLWVDEAGEWGLEYLFGVVEAPPAAASQPGIGAFRPFWAHDRTQERQALLDFLAYVAERRATHPGMHVYHYAAYEKTALLRLSGRYGVGEEEVDDLLRAGVLVDLYQAVRACLRIGGPSYSLKKLEPLYMEIGRSGDVQTAGESVVEYSEACEVHDAGRIGEWQERLDRIAEYNAYDCRSTLGLRDWLVARAAEAGVVAGTAAAEAEAQRLVAVATPVRELSARECLPDGAPQPEEDDLVQRLLAVADGGPTGAGRSDEQQAVAMLAAAVGYHWREAKPHWWAHFDRLVSEPAEWTDGRNTFLVAAAEVVEPWHTPPGKRTPRRHLRLVGRLEPGSSLTRDDQVCALYDRPVPQGLSTTVEGLRGWTDKVAVLSATAQESGGVLRDVLLVEERVGAGGEHDALPMALTPGPPLRTDGIAAAIRGLAEQVAAVLTGPESLPDQPALDLLRRRPPRTLSGALPTAGPGSYVAAITSAAADLDGSYLAVQGPPGTGKTYTGARVIAALVGRGWRIGVVAQSHTVVENMLREVAGAGVAPAAIGKKPRPGELPDDDAPWHWIHKNLYGDFYARQRGGYVVGGTAWDFTTPARMPDRPLDLLVVDEAGQFALADTVAVSTAARNLLLLGDPQQLPQVTQGRHPEPVDCSALGWLTDSRDTLPAGLGYFLAHTWRMHPELCAVVSRLSYEGRLSSVGPAAERSLDDVAPGVGCVLVDHDGNAVASVEEAAEVVTQVRAVLGRRWRDPAAGVDRPLEGRDVVVVAAYNAQVWTVRTALDAAGLGAVRVGTVDRFQGQQAVVVVLTTAASSPADVPRGMDFLLDRNRVNVAISRAQWRAVVVRSSGLTDYLPRTPEALGELGAFLGICSTIRR